MFVDVFIRRPILSTVLSLFLVLAGALAIPTMPVAQYPEVAPPQVTVTAVYPGADAETLETAVTTPLEQAINGAEGMLYMSSSSSNGGMAMINVTFDVTRDIDIASVDVQNRVNQVMGRLPAEVRQTGVTVQKQSTNFVMGAGVFSDREEYDALFMSNYLDVHVKDALMRVPGVADVFIFGERRYSMRLWLDPVRLAARQVTASDVVAALQEQNVQVAAGSLGEPPAPVGQIYQMSVRAAGRLREAEEFGNIIVKSGRDGSLVRMSDVGRAELGAETYASALRFQGMDAVGFAVIALPNANALDVEQGVLTELRRLEPTFPPGLQYRVAFSTTEVVAQSIQEAVKTLLQAIGLVVLVLFFFLQSWRATMIPVLTLPVSLIGAFAFIKLMGFSINTLTLFGIVLATGIVVDDAIVVIENIERHIQEYKKRARVAALDAMREVVSPVIATSVVLFAVFVPVAFFPGTTGRMYAQFAVTIAFAVALSSFNALTLTPALSALLLDRPSHRKALFFRAVEGVISAGSAGYGVVLRLLMRVRWAMVAVFVAALFLTYFVYTRVPQSFLPEEDPGWFMTAVQTPPGSSLEFTSRAAAQAERILLDDPDVRSVFSVIGFSFGGGTSNQGLIFASLQPFEERTGSEQSVQQVLARLRGPLFSIRDAVIVPFVPPSIPGLGFYGGFTFQVLDQTGGEIENLAAATQTLVGAAGQSPRLGSLFSSFTANDPQMVVDIDREMVRSLGMPISEVTDALRILLGSAYVNDFDFNHRAYRVTVQAESEFRSNPQVFDAYHVRTGSGEMAPLSSMIRVRETTSPQVISHFNLFRSAEINGAAAPGFSSGQAIEEMERLAQTTLPPGMGYAWSGLALEEIEAGARAAFIFGIAVLIVYLTLAALYESLVLPLIILTGVPLATLGGLGAQWARGLENDIYCQIGLILLIGLAAKNSILVVEFAERLRAQGASVMEAAMEAARIRLRPILMTSLAFLFAVMPLVFASGAGQAGRWSVGTAVAGGMLVATFLNVVFTPCLYVVVQSLRREKARFEA
ncbi:MAG TPA: efflux RND transporter permease subunit [Acidobacteriota bacterium]|nr:efflux RND transporter permease subunit [Acidobacteriota bacterium]